MENNGFRSQVENPAHYDRIVKLVVLHNRFMEGSTIRATDMVNLCIQGVGREPGSSYAIGMCMGMRTMAGKVRLFLEPLCPVDG
jgi:hypothetical protein